MNHYFSEKQTSILKVKIINVNLLNNGLEFNTGSGVFSKGKVDKGTKLLIESVYIKGNSILDIGCGYGVIGISIAKAFPKKKVLMTDINTRALYLTKKNIKLNNVGCEVIYSNLYDNIKGKFNLILSNVPQKAGKKICFAIIEGAKQHLIDFGELAIVGRHNKGGRSLQEKMKELFGNVSVAERSGGFRVYVSQKLT